MRNLVTLWLAIAVSLATACSAPEEGVLAFCSHVTDAPDTTIGEALPGSWECQFQTVEAPSDPRICKFYEGGRFTEISPDFCGMADGGGTGRWSMAEGRVQFAGGVTAGGAEEPYEVSERSAGLIELDNPQNYPPHIWLRRLDCETECDEALPR